MTSDDRFIAMLVVFAAVTIALSAFRVRRRKRDGSVYRSLRPRAWRRDDDWRFWVPPAVIVVVALIVWFVDR